MFKRFDPSNDVSTSTQVKASVQRSIKSQISAANPEIKQTQLDALLPKKMPLVQFKVGPHLMIYCRHPDENDDDSDNDEKSSPDNVPFFFQSRDGPVLPTLKLVHQYPQLKFTSVTVDNGAIPFVLGGANIMCPGLTNKGGVMPVEELEKGAGVVIYAEGKEYALAIGTMKMSSLQVRSKNKGIGIEVAHYLGDGLYQTNDIS